MMVKKNTPKIDVHQEKESAFTDVLLEVAQKGNPEVLKLMSTQMEGLREEEASSCIKLYGLNEVASEKKLSWLIHLFNNMKNPLIILLTVLAIISYSTGDIRATVVIAIMIVLGVVLRFFLGLMMIGYLILTQLVKIWFIKKYSE